MPGGLMNLTAIGNANVILTGEPTKTFFKAFYSKYTNFGLQKFRLDYDGLREIRLTEPSVFQFKVGRYADLLMDTYVSITLPDIWSPIHHPTAETNGKWATYDFRWIRNLGTNLIKEITVSCGSMILAKYSGKYIEMMVERDFSDEKKDVFNKMSGNTDEFYDPANWSGRANTYPSAYFTGDSTVVAEPSIRGRTIYIPINSWFTFDSRCAFPLICLQYNELNITVEMRAIQELFQVRDVYDPTNNYPYVQPDFNLSQFAMYRFLQTPPAVKITPNNYENKNTTWNADVHLVATYCFLDDAERRQMALEDQVYLVKDVFEYNYQNIVGTKRINLQSSSGMVSNWLWFFQRNDVNMRNEWSNYTNWPYVTVPNNLRPAPQDSYDLDYATGPGIQPVVPGQIVGTNTGFYVTGQFSADNLRDIMVSSGILLNGSYRENVQPAGIFEYLEKYTRTAGNGTKPGIYCYNFCLNSDIREYQPSGAINMSKFKTVELEIATITPAVSANNANFQIVCDVDGNPIGINKTNWRLYDYTFNMTLFEERYNILSFISGNCAMLYAR